MSKKLLMDNYSENDEIILCENFSPNKQPFYLWQDKIIDWDNYELYMNINLTDYKQPYWGNVLSIGVAINSWIGRAKWHIYYNGHTKKIRLQCVDSSGNDTLDYSLDNPSEVELIINKKGAYLNNELKLYNSRYIPITNNVFATSPISIGSQEGTFKGVAQYNLVCLRKYQERG